MVRWFRPLGEFGTTCHLALWSGRKTLDTAVAIRAVLGENETWRGAPTICMLQFVVVGFG